MSSNIITYIVVIINEDGTKTNYGSVRHPDGKIKAEKVAEALRAEGKVVEVIPYIGPTTRFDV
jgi:hypothetical protein